MTLVDSSVWVDFLRRPADDRNEPLRRLVRASEAAIAAPIEMELLMGPRDELVLRRVERLLGGLQGLDTVPDLDFRSAAAIHRAVRRTGRTVRSKLDCLIAAIALRHEVPLLHKDTDFAAIAQVTHLDHLDLRDDT